MKKMLALFFVLSLSVSAALVQAQKSVNPNDIVDLELLTHTEVTDKLHQGKTSILIVAGGTEERGPHDVLGGHTFLSRYARVRLRSGSATTLVAPVLPIAVNATGLREARGDQPARFRCRPTYSSRCRSPKSKAWR